jgi:hypothetical protein
VNYPPEPWDLRGQLFLSVFAVPRDTLPALPDPLAATVRPVTVGRKAIVGVAWVRYEPGGVLTYEELLAAALTRSGRRLRVSITDIWVDSVPSRDGGRALWGIPKDLAELTVHTGPSGRTSGAASTARGPIAAASFSPGIRLPGRWPTPMTLAQAFGDTVKHSPVRGHARLRLGGATWRIEPGGPLRHLAGRRPLLTATLADFRLRFGAQADTTYAPAGAPPEA